MLPLFHKLLIFINLSTGSHIFFFKTSSWAVYFESLYAWEIFFIPFVCETQIYLFKLTWSIFFKTNFFFFFNLEGRKNIHRITFRENPVLLLLSAFLFSFSRKNTEKLLGPGGDIPRACFCGILKLVRVVWIQQGWREGKRLRDRAGRKEVIDSKMASNPIPCTPEPP